MLRLLGAILLPLTCFCDPCSRHYVGFVRNRYQRISLLSPANLPININVNSHHSLLIKKQSLAMVKGFGSSDFSYQDEIVGIYRRITSNITRLRDPQQRSLFFNQVRDSIRLVYKSSIASFSEGNAGERGEGWLAAQVLVTIFVLSEVPIVISLLFRLSSLLLAATGVSLMLGSLWELREFFSPFLVPLSQSRLIRSGVYEYLRHPMYGGLVLLCLGLSIFSNNCDKLFLTIILASLLVRRDRLFNHDKHYNSHPLSV